MKKKLDGLAQPYLIAETYLKIMKKLLLPTLFAFAFAFSANAEMRTFICPEGERSFNGRLLAYNDDTKTVTVQNAQRQTLHFDIAMISEDDQKYVKTKAPSLPVNVALDVRFETIRDRQGTDRAGNSRTTTYDAGYNIVLNNYSPTGVQTAKVEYLLIYRKDDTADSGENKIVSGSTTVSIEPNGSHEISTDTVQLVNFFQRGSVRSSGCCGRTSTTASRSLRSRDYLVGCVVRVIANGEVIETAATAPNILRAYEDHFSSSYSYDD